MTDSDGILVSKGEGSGRALSLEERRRKLTAISARVGVWGIIGGLGSILAAPLGPGIAVNLMGLGFLAGGVGAIGTSILVAKDLKRASLPLKLATIVGFPFGASLAVIGVSQLMGLPFLFPFLALAIPVGLFLGVLLMVLLLAGFLSHAFLSREPDWEN